MIALSVAKLKMFSPENEIFLGIKPKKKKKTFLWKVWINADVKKYAKRQEMFFVMSLRLSDHKVLHNITSSSSFFRFRSDFPAFFARISYFKFWSLRNLIKQLFHSCLLDMRLVIAISPSHIQRVLMK